MNNKQSQIYGKGYGNSHTWTRIRTLKLPYYALPEQKKSTYECSVCGVVFDHYYDTEKDIFKAIEKSGVSNMCPISKDC